MSRRLRGPGPRVVSGAIRAACAAIVVLAFAGTVRGFSPIPWWDMWDGYVDFFLRVRAGETAAWWGQHNEHRLVLSRLLFWPDIEWLGGRGVLPLVANLVVVSAVAATFVAVLRAIAGRRDDGGVRGVAGAIVVAWLFSWVQGFNLAGAFQIQFFLAYALPLWALLALHRSSGPDAPGRWFAIACLLGLASWGTMANGILVGPLMVVHALAIRPSPARIGVLAALSAASIATYLHGYVPGPNATGIGQALATHPLKAAAYVVLYVGGPFFHLFGGSGLGRVAASLAGLGLLAAAARLAWREVRSRPRDSLRVALLCFVAFVVGSAVVTAAGRVGYGLSQALADRYATPALMAWATIAVLCAPALPAARHADRTDAPMRWAAALVLLLLVFQVRALVRPHEAFADREVGALALALGVRDPASIGTVYPDPDHALSIARRAVDARLSVFADAPYAGLSARLGHPVGGAPAPGCEAVLEPVQALDGEARWVRIAGRVRARAGDRAPAFVELLDAQSRVAGIAMVAEPRVPTWVPGARGPDERRFRGYLLADRADGPLRIVAPEGGCATGPRAAARRDPDPGPAVPTRAAGSRIMATAFAPLGHDPVAIDPPPSDARTSRTPP